ncbi:MAG: hypothetical protein D3926_14010 [Desulfobacteraceae bacterium]|nr:MAG: hypothetical protein D3926_14010 [Desulfobacteraceae bacterium]
MNASQNETDPAQTKADNMAQDLCTFAIDRTDLKSLMGSIPEDHQLNLTTLEYELSILKILAAGWGISFYMAATDPDKSVVSNSFWMGIREISQQISTLTQTTTGQEINYFDILKNRLDAYMAVMQDNPEQATDPTQVIGPAFARACGSENDAMAILIGTKMFTLTMGAVKEYIDNMKRPSTQRPN